QRACDHRTTLSDPTRRTSDLLAIGGAISAANHDGACASDAESDPPPAGRKASGASAASFTTIRTWRTSRRGEERSARNFSAGTSDRKSTRLNSSHEWISYAVF